MTSNCLINASEPFCVRMMENESAQCVFAFCRPEICDVTKVKYKQKQLLQTQHLISIIIINI